MEIVVLIIVLALVFDFYNGMNDAANSIATIVSTRVLTPLQAVIWAAFFNFIAAFIFGVHVATTIGTGIVDVNIIDNYVVLSGVIGAIILTASATHFGLPISVSHAIIGGFGGAAIIKAGFGALIISGYTKVVIFIFLAPILGMVMALIFSLLTMWLVRNKNPRKVDKQFRRLQLLSAALYSLSHGSNAAQKTIGIILRSNMGYIFKLFFYCTWYFNWRLESNQNPWNAYYQIISIRWIQRRNFCRINYYLGNYFGNPRKYNSHNYRFHYRCRIN